MTSTPGRGLLHLAAAVDQTGADSADSYVELARLAESGGLDFVTLDDGPSPPGPDALRVLARAAPATRRIGLVATVAAGPAEPWLVPAGVAGLERESRGRAGWRVREPARAAVLPAPAPPPAEEAPSSRDPVRVVDATDPPDRAAAARYADVALVRVAGSAQAGVVRTELRSLAAGFGRNPDALRVLAGLVVDLGDGERGSEQGWGAPLLAPVRGLGRGGRRSAARGPLFRGGPVDLAELIAAWHEDGTADGFHLTPVDPRRDLERVVNGTVALLQHRGRFRTFYPGGTLREHLGLSRTGARLRAGGG
ncbi:LLM class flavin-dependent oxidoreductase [Streptomyces mangrovisoli]|uniref:FMNH2-dependent monooxygenase n=1 Tax=Streptomyces mangrovisoli TaxID=1428628 RepID=A0A1J4NP70_9ACTN|nr:LLM class flavin-dependent oxidoreductase [Streptomyces mangrovisoli]OIJ64159.1 FMNH2-dependent monooxygenase [Streptomyces mangrovisoli]